MGRDLFCDPSPKPADPLRAFLLVVNERNEQRLHVHRRAHADQKKRIAHPARRLRRALKHGSQCATDAVTFSRASTAMLATAMLWLCFSPITNAQQTHVVRSGQSLARIARRYDVRVSDLAAANELSIEAQVRPGQELRIPESGIAYVRPGQTLSEIARDARCSVADIVRLNRLRDGQSLRPGQRLVLPGHVESRESQRAQTQWGRPRAPGVATIYRTATRARTRLRLVDSRGRASRRAFARLSEIMRPRRSPPRSRHPQPPARLLELLARTSDHFGGRTIHLISGFRPAGGYTRETSQHVAGHAIDFRIEGVPNTVLRDYLRTFDRVGVGFYPRSSFVHFDVRDRNAYWVDWSRPGERPQYQRRGEPPPNDATPEERTRVGEGGDDVSDEGGEGAVATEEE